MIVSFPQRSFWNSLFKIPDLFRISVLGFRISLPFTCAFLVWASSSSFAANGWFSIHGDDGNNAYWPVATRVENLTTTLAWDTGSAELLAGSGMAWREGIVYTVAMRDGGNWDPSDDHVWIKAMYASDGTPYWESPVLETGNSASYATITGPTIDPADGAIYYGAGRTMNRINPADGSVVWSTKLTSATTAAAGSLELINSSAAVGSGKVFVSTYDDYMGGYRDKQIVAFQKDNGAIAWSRMCGGTGRTRPIYANGIVYTEVFDGVTSHGIAAYAAADGALVWNSITAAPKPWSTAKPIEAPFICVANRIYGVSYSGTGTGQLFCCDASNGSLIWKVGSIESDTTPLLIGGTIYLYGGPFGGSQLVAYRASDGAYVRTTTIGGYCFRNAMSATNDRIYLTQSDFFGSDPTTDLVVVNANDGSIVARQTLTYGGPVMLDPQGNLFVHYTVGGIGGLRAFGNTRPAPSAASMNWLNME